MPEIPQIVLPHGGYRKLIAYRKSETIYQATVLFCRRFLPKFGDRTVDQMTQAARSCKQNIAEGSASNGTSKETEIKLTNVARATLDELLEDYLDYFKAHGAGEWAVRDEKKTSVTMVGGKPVVSYTPQLNDAEKAKRKYTTWGKVKLQDVKWVEVPSGSEDDYNFFKVTVEMR